MNLKDKAIFRGLEQEEIKEVLKKVGYKEEVYEKGETVAFRGDEVRDLVIVLEGVLAAEMQKDTGEHIRIEDLEEGQVVASAFIFGRKNFFPVDVVCKTDVKVFKISKEELIKLFQLNGVILKNYLDDVSTRTQFLSQKIWFDFKNKTLIEKLRAYILENLKGDEIVLKSSLKELSETFGVARPSLSRALAVLVDEGIIERLGRNHYRLIDEEALMFKE